MNDQHWARRYLLYHIQRPHMVAGESLTQFRKTQVKILHGDDEIGSLSFVLE
jgi:hypothetical protein